MAGIFLSAIVSGLLQAAGPASYAARHPAVYTGVYLIRFCHGTCAAPTLAGDRTGTLVLSGRPLLNQRGWWMRQEMGREPVNGCLLLDPARMPGESGPFDPQTPRRRFVTWVSGPGPTEVGFAFEHSVDSGSMVTLRLSALGLHGYGFGYGFPAVTDQAGRLQRDEVVATRLGAVDVARCPRPPPHHPVDAGKRDAAVTTAVGGQPSRRCRRHAVLGTQKRAPRGALSPTNAQ